MNSEKFIFILVCVFTIGAAIFWLPDKLGMDTTFCAGLSFVLAIIIVIKLGLAD
jgi:hypothetical protein